MSHKRVQILDPILANQIAAGEVVERPASAAKELIENAIDAGATEITVEVKDGGRSLLRVVDNGHGMSQSDALLALERHATSKISVVDDLNRIHTLGFRGEALPSIASVSRFTLKTRTQDHLMATQLELEGGTQLKVSEASGRVGTEVRVEDLFFNVPARRKFLKSSATETQLISDTFQRVALCDHQVACRFIKDGHISFDYPQHRSLLERIEAMFGTETATKLHPVSSHGQLTIEGLISFPDHTYSAHRHGYTFINDRFVKDKLFLGAIQRAYGLRLPKGRFPFYVLKVQVNPSMVDVNVHPAKTEVRFAEEEVFLDLLTKAIRGAVSRFPQASEEDHRWSIIPGGLSFAQTVQDQAQCDEEEGDAEQEQAQAQAQEQAQAQAQESFHQQQQESVTDHLGSSALERHRTLIRSRIGGRVFEGDQVATEQNVLELDEPRHHYDQPRVNLETAVRQRKETGRHEVLRISQAELMGEEARPTHQEQRTTTSAIQSTSQPLLSPNLPPLLALAQPGALNALRAIGRADAWWLQEAADGLLLTHLPSLYAHMLLTQPLAMTVQSALHLTLSPRQSEDLKKRRLEPLGIRLDKFGGQSYRLTQLPKGFEEDWGEDVLQLITTLLSCAVGEERVVWVQQLSQQMLSTSARARVLAWLQDEGRTLIEQGSAPSCFVMLPWSSLLKQRAGLPIF